LRRRKKTKAGLTIGFDGVFDDESVDHAVDDGVEEVVEEGATGVQGRLQRKTSPDFHAHSVIVDRTHNEDITMIGR
jgi:hypothetical protein